MVGNFSNLFFKGFNFLLDFLLLGFIFRINNIEELNILIKLTTSIVIMLATVFRLYYLLKNKK